MSEPELLPAAATNVSVSKPRTRNALVEDCAFGRNPDCTRVASYDPSTDDGLTREIMLTSPTDWKARETDGQEIDVVHWVCGRRVMPDKQTGEDREGPFLAFELASGDTWGTGSAGAVRSWATIVAAKGPGPYNPPLRVLVKHTKLSDGRPYYILMPVSKEPA